MSDDESAPSSRPPSPISALPNTARPYRFTWDPASRRQGPESVSGTTEGRDNNNYFAAQPRLGIYPSSLSLAVGALPQEWSSTTHGFHAISTVLNNPHKRQAPPKAHSHLPPVVPADLPRVRRKDFDSYLRAIGPEWDRFQHNASLGRDGVPQLDDSHPVSLPGLKSVPPLDTVPQVFFSQNFTLSDPRTFDAVTADADPTALAHALPLLEKFSHYADTVEQHLVLEISHRAPSFFAALTNLHDLRAESEHCLERIASLRGLLTDLDNNSAKKGLDLVRRQARAANITAVTDSVKQVASVVEMGRVARALVGAGQWGQALGVIEEMERMWEHPAAPNNTDDTAMPTLTEEDEDAPPAKKPSQIPLSSLRAYSALPDHLRSLTMEIAASLSSELVSVLRDDLTQRKDRNTDLDLRDRLRPLLQGLVRTRGVKEGLLSWREVVLGEVRQVVRSRQPEEDANEEVKAAKSPQLRSMPHPEFMLLLQDLYADLLRCLEGIQAQSAVIISILEAESGKLKELGPAPASSTTSILTPSQAQDELIDLLSSASELSNTLSASLLTPRLETHSSLELADFLTLFNASWSFVLACEVLSRRMIVGLRGVVVGQAKAFLQVFHQKRITQSAKLVEDEQWGPVEITKGLQRITDAIVDSAVRDAPELVIKGENGVETGGGVGEGGRLTGLASSHTPSETPPQHLLSKIFKPTANGNGNGHGNGAGFGEVKEAGSKHLRIEDRTYFAVGATTEVLVLLLDYLRVVVNLSMLTTDTMSRAIEFLKAFNSRTCQVVLGAGAMRSAGLKNITAKHLALASQSLSIMFELIPYVRETFRRHLSPKQAVMLVEFDKLKRDYQEHQNEIHSKLIAIMGDRLSTQHIKSLQTVDWNVPKPGGGVNDYMEYLVKETVLLHKVLSRYLSTPVVEYVMTQVFAAINHGLSEEYGKIELPHQEAKTRLLADAKYLHQKLSALKDVAAPSGMLVTVVSEKSIPRTGPASPIPAPIPTPTRANTLGANARLKGLLSGKSMGFDKALPTPAPTRTSSMLSPPLHPRPGSPAALASTSTPNSNSNMNGATLHREDSTTRRTSTSISTSASPPSTSTSPQPRRASAGFKQVELPLPVNGTLNSDPGPEPRPGPGGAGVDVKPAEKLAPLGTREPMVTRTRTLSPPLPVPPHDIGTPTPPEPATGQDSGAVEAEGTGEASPHLGLGDEGAQGAASGAINEMELDLGLEVPSQSLSAPNHELPGIPSPSPPRSESPAPLTGNENDAEL